MELTISRVIWLVLGIALTVAIGIGVYTWATRAFVKTEFMATIVAYDSGRVEITLKNLGTVDITDLKVNLAKADGQNVNQELSVMLADGSSFTKLPAGDEVQLIISDWTNNGAVSAKNTLTFEIICTFANGKVVSHTYTVSIQS